MKENLISIITPMYNAENYIGQTIESVLHQTYSEWEMFIINDGSKDNCAEIVKKYAEKDNRIKLINQSNSGASVARNNGITNAQGRYICFLDADDLWEPIFLQEQLSFLKENNAVFVCSAHKRIDKNNQEILKPFTPPKQVNYFDILKTCSISILTVMLDRKEIKDIFFDDTLKNNLREDFVLWLQILKKIPFVYGNPKILASYRISQTSVSYNKKKMAKCQFRIYYNIEKLGIIKSCYYFCCWAINGFLKYRK